MKKGGGAETWNKHFIWLMNFQHRLASSLCYSTFFLPRCFTSLLFEKTVNVYRIFVTFPNKKYLILMSAAIVITDIRLSTHNDFSRWMYCPVGSLPCDPSADASQQCVEESRWCDLNDDCTNGQDEDLNACCKRFSLCTLK
jgi:hypothetical protein